MSSPCSAGFRDETIPLFSKAKDSEICEERERKVRAVQLPPEKAMMCKHFVLFSIFSNSYRHMWPG